MELVPLVSPQWAMGSYGISDFGFGIEDPWASTSASVGHVSPSSTVFVGGGCGTFGSSAGAEPISPTVQSWLGDGYFVGGGCGSFGGGCGGFDTAALGPSSNQELEQALRTAMPDHYED